MSPPADLDPASVPPGDQGSQPGPPAAAVHPLVLSIDELRAVCRVTDAVLPVFVTEGDAETEAVDVAALRGLAARDLVELTDDGNLSIADELLDALAPTRGARLLAEVDQDDGFDTTTWAVLGGDAGPSTIMIEQDPGLVAIEVAPVGVAEVVSGRCALGDVRPDPQLLGFTVASAAHEAMAEAIDHGATSDAVAALVDAGASPDAGTAFVAALAARRRAVAVQVARNLGTGDDGPFEAGEVRWVEAADGTAWRVVVELSDEDESADGLDDAGLDDAGLDDAGLDDAGSEARLAAAVTTIGSDELRGVIRDVLTPAASVGATGDQS